MSIKATPKYNLQVCNPDLAKEWHPTKNGSLLPKDVFPNSGRKVWWLCKNGHEWEAKVDNRNRGAKCQRCSGTKASAKVNFAISFPSLAREWHPTKNSIKPEDITKGCGRNFWWLCKNGHEYQAKPIKRAAGHNCPYCSGRRVDATNSLQTCCPAIAAQWCSSKNGLLTPRDVTRSSNKKVWWECEKGHQWQVQINSRTGKGKNSGCPYCGNKKVCYDNCLQTVNSDLSKEWHPTKNHSLTPADLTPFSHKKVWWQCKRGHEWQAIVYSRYYGAGCPLCNSKTSRLELRIFSELKKIFCDAQHRMKVSGVECDIYIPNFKIAVEIDGRFWHKDKLAKERAKQKKLEKSGVSLLRVREQGLVKISDTDVFFSGKCEEIEIVSQIAKSLAANIHLNPAMKRELEQYANEKKFINEYEFENLLSLLPGPLPGLSLAEKNPALASQWHPTKNKLLTSSDLSWGSDRKVWWLCEKGHEWQASVCNRSNGRGCPYCFGKLVDSTDSLASLMPALAEEWNYEKNSDLSPRDVKPRALKKVWWKCKNGHEWESYIISRSKGAACPSCRCLLTKKALSIVKPLLVKEWHNEKNAPLTPELITYGSDKKVWWKCSKGHEWQAKVTDRSKGRDCPQCRQLKRMKQLP